MDHAEKIAETIEQFKGFCLEQRLMIFAADRVLPEVAAKLLGVTEGCLRNWRSQLTGPEYERSGSGQGRIFYRLQALAEFTTR